MRSGSRANASGNTFSATVAFELGVFRAVHFTHATRADGREDLVGPETRSGSEGHRVID